MSKLLLVNPRSKPRSKPRTAAQKRATTALVRRNKAKSATPAKRRTSASGASKRRRVTRPRVTRARVARSTRRIGRSLSRSGIIGSVKNSAIGAGGAIAVDVAFAKLPIPAFLKSGKMVYVSKAALAIGLGMMVSKFASKELGNRMAEGALTVAAYSAMRGMVGSSLGLSGVEDYADPGISGVGYYNPALVMGGVGVGEYMSETTNMGEYMGGEESEYQY